MLWMYTIKKKINEQFQFRPTLGVIIAAISYKIDMKVLRKRCSGISFDFSKVMEWMNQDWRSDISIRALCIFAYN